MICDKKLCNGGVVCDKKLYNGGVVCNRDDRMESVVCGWKEWKLFVQVAGRYRRTPGKQRVVLAVPIIAA